MIYIEILLLDTVIKIDKKKYHTVSVYSTVGIIAAL